MRRASTMTARREPAPALPAALRKTRLVLDLDGDMAELLAWNAGRLGYDLRDYVLDLLFDAATEVPDRVRAVR